MASKDHSGHKFTAVREPSDKLIFHDGHDWWSRWKGADYKNVGNGGPTMYRHNEGAIIGFYDGHAERLAKEKVWIANFFISNPKQPGMWVAVPKVWNKYR